MDNSAFEAVYSGARQAGKSVGALVLMVIAFISLYYFFDATLAWLGSRVGLDTSLSVSWLCLLQRKVVSSKQGRIKEGTFPLQNKIQFTPS